MSAFAKVPVWMSVAEFLAWDSDDPYRYELVDGEPRRLAPDDVVHGYLQATLGGLIADHLRSTDHPCVVLTGVGVIPRFLADQNYRVADIAVTRTPVRPDQMAIVDPKLLIDILSPSSQSKTWANVRAYTSIPSVAEILIPRSDRVSAELLRRDPNGAWPEKPVAVSHGGVMLDSIGYSLDLAALYARTGLAP